MYEQATHLVDIRTIPAADLDGLVISQVSQAGQTVVLSTYGDARWDLRPYIHTRNVRANVSVIKFDTGLGNGTLLTDDQNKSLLAAAKRFLYVRWKVRAPHSGRYISARTVIGNWKELRVLLLWMAREGIFSFSELTVQRCLEYVRYCQNERGLGEETRWHYYTVITIYYDLREYLEDRMPEYPWPNTTASLLAGRRRLTNGSGVLEGTTEVIPTKILKLIVARALEYVEQKAEKLLYVRDSLLAIRKEVYPLITARHRKRHPQGFFRTYKSENEYLETKTLDYAGPRIKRLFAENGFQKILDLKDELQQLRIACYIICAVFSGMRSAELASLEDGSFVRHKGFDDEDYYWLKGKTYKLETDPKDAEWMVPRIVGKAVEIAEKLSVPLREELRNRIACLTLQSSATLLPDAKKALFHELSEARKHENSLFLCKSWWVGTLAQGNADKLLKEFTARSGAIVEPQDLVGVKDLNKVKVGEPWPLAAHQFRRTFAVLVSRNLMGDIRYLREHFKHWSIDMTLYYTRHEQSFVDDSLISEIMAERDELQALLVENWLSSEKKLSGGRGRRLVSYRRREEVKTIDNMREFCRKLGEDVFIRGTGHSWCLCSDSKDAGHCLYDAIRCSKYCEDSVIDDTHIQVWRGIREQQIEVLQCPDLGEPSWQRCVDHLREAERVLGELGDTVDPYAIPASPWAQAR